MRQLIAKRYVIRQNLLAFIGFCLCFYFAYHLLLGERSYMRLMSLERSIQSVQVQYDDIHGQRTTIESKVRRLRPDSLDKDMLEERARYVLGFAYKDEHLVFGVN